MSRLTWETKYLIGIEKIDEDHKYLVTQLDVVYNMFVSGDFAKIKYVEILDSLSDYAARHFAFEEKWMADNNYPQIEDHILDHQRFTQRVTEFIASLHDGSGRLSLEIISFLRVWLLTHISMLDTDLGVFHCAGADRDDVVGL